MKPYTVEARSLFDQVSFQEDITAENHQKAQRQFHETMQERGFMDGIDYVIHSISVNLKLWEMA